MREILLAASVFRVSSLTNKKKLFDSSLLCFGLLLLIIWLVVREFHFSEIPAAHHSDYNNQRISMLAGALREGNSGRWLRGFNFGWGYPLFYYTAALPYLLGAGLILLGFPLAESVNLLWLLLICGCGFSMYFSTKAVFGNWGALLSATAYLFAPYFLMDVYARGNLNETTLFLFLPILFRAIFDLQRNPRSVPALLMGGVAAGALIFSHLLALVLVGLGFGVFVCVLCAINFKSTPGLLLGAVKIALIGLGLSAFFWIPALFDLSAVQGKEFLETGYYSYKSHFVYLEQLFSLAWGYGISTDGPGDGLSFSLGPEILLIAFVTFIFSSWKMIRRRASDVDRLAFSVCVAALAVIFLSLPFSQPVWERIPAIQILQFPWRWHVLSAFFLALAAGAAVPIFNNFFSADWMRKVAAAALIILICVTEFQHAEIQFYQSPKAEEYSVEVLSAKGTNSTDTGEFLPVGNTHYPTKSDLPSDPAAILSRNGKLISGLPVARITDGQFEAKVFLSEPSRLVVYQFFHPAWQAVVDGQSAQLGIDSSHPLHPLMLDLPVGRHEVQLKFGFTTAGKIGGLMTILMLIVCFGMLLRRKQRT